MRPDALHRWLRPEWRQEQLGERNRADAVAWPLRQRLARLAMHRQPVVLLRRLRRVERPHPMCVESRAPDLPPSRLRWLNAEWHDHRHRYERGPMESCPNGVGRNQTRVGSDDPNLFDLKNLNGSLIRNQNETEPPNEARNLTENRFRIGLKNPSHRLNGRSSTENRQCRFVWAFLPMMNALNSPMPSGLRGEPNYDRLNSPRTHLGILPLRHPSPEPTSPMDDRRLEGCLTCPSATNWKKKDWPWTQPTGPRPQGGKRRPERCGSNTDSLRNSIDPLNKIHVRAKREKDPQWGPFSL